MARGTTTNLPREAILAAGAFTALGTGAIYMWSIFNKPLMEGIRLYDIRSVHDLFAFPACIVFFEHASWLASASHPTAIHCFRCGRVVWLGLVLLGLCR